MTSKVAFRFDPSDLLGIDSPSREAKQAIADRLVEEVIAYCGDGKSPVAGGAWKRSLSAAYKKFKQSQGGNGYADMILDGDMLSALECVITSSGELELRIKGKEAGKADGHNNHSGQSELPPREFIPKDGETFKTAIIRALRDVAREVDGE